MKEITSNQFKVLIFLIIFLVAIILLFYFILEKPSALVFIGLIIAGFLIPLIFWKTEVFFLALVTLRSAIDIISENKILNLFNFSFNLASILGIFILLWGFLYIKIKQLKLKEVPGIFPISLFLGICGFSFFYSANFTYSLEEFIRFINMFLIYVIIYHLIRSKKDLGKIILIPALAMIIPSFFGISQIISKSGISVEGISNRIFGTFTHPNGFAFALVLTFVSLITYQIANQGKKRLLWLGMGVLFFLLLFTYTRGAWIGLVTFLFILGIFRYQKTLFISLVVIGLVILYFPALSNITKSAYSFDFKQIQFIKRITVREEDSSFAWRVRLWQEMKEKFIKKPIFGWGLGIFPLVRASQDPPEGESLIAHNDYVKLSIETGLLGLLSYLLIFIFILKKAFKIYFEAGEKYYQYLALGFIGLTISFLIMSGADNILRYTAFEWLFWTLAGSVMAIPQIKLIVKTDSVEQNGL